MTAKPLLYTAIMAGTMLCANDARGERPSYMGAHAIPESRDGAFCYIDLAHTHTYPPDATLLEQFVQHEQSSARYEFIGDPGDFDFQGLSFAYFGAHPISVDDSATAGDTLCARPGQHAHLRDPANPERYEERDGVYYFESYRKAKRADRKARRSKRSSRAARRSAKRPGKQSEVRLAPARAPAASTSSKPTATAKTVKRDAHRSWMNRRLGR